MPREREKRIGLRLLGEQGSREIICRWIDGLMGTS